MVDLHGWVALWGQETSGECGAARRRDRGLNSGVGPKPEEGHRPGNGCVPPFEDREVDPNHEAGASNQCDARTRGTSSGGGLTTREELRSAVMRCCEFACRQFTLRRQHG